MGAFFTAFTGVNTSLTPISTETPATVNLDNLWDTLGDVASKVVGSLAPSAGYDVSIFYPVAMESIYQEEGNTTNYDLENPNVSGRFLISGLESLRLESGGSELDLYSLANPVLMYADKGIDLDDNSLVIIMRSGDVVTMRVRVAQEYGGRGESVLRVYPLVPMEI